MTVRGCVAGVGLVALAGMLLAGCAANSFDSLVSRLRSDPAQPGTTEGADVTIVAGAKVELAEFAISDVYAAAATLHDSSEASVFWSVGYPKKPSINDEPASSSIEVTGTLPPPAVLSVWQQVLDFDSAPIVTSGWKAGVLDLDLRYPLSTPSGYFPESVLAGQALLTVGVPFHFTVDGPFSTSELDSPACTGGASPGQDTASGELAAALAPLPATISAGACA